MYASAHRRAAARPVGGELRVVWQQGDELVGKREPAL